MKTKNIPVIVGALGMIKKGSQKYVNEIPGNLSLAEIQKIVLNSMAHIFLEEPFHSKRKTRLFNTHYFEILYGFFIFMQFYY